MRATRCHGEVAAPKVPSKSDSSRGCSRRAFLSQITQSPMNKFERQSRQPADQQILPEAIVNKLPQLPGEVIDISDAPPIAPRAALTPGEVSTILMSPLGYLLTGWLNGLAGRAAAALFLVA